jgi:hypothetical protein
VQREEEHVVGTIDDTSRREASTNLQRDPMHVVHAAEIDPMRVVFGEHDGFLSGLEEELEAVSHVGWMAAHPLA